MSNPPTEPAQPFNWRDHVKISEDFKADQRDLIEKSFDRMAQFHDGEGEQLIRAAAQRAGGPVLVMPSDINAGELGRMKLDFDKLGSNHYTNDPQGRGPSLLGTMVHEMYHMTDAQADLEQHKARNVMSTIQRADGTSLRAPELYSLGIPEDEIYFRLRRGSTEERAEFADLLEKTDSPRLQEYGAMVRATTNEQWIDRFQKAGVTDETGTALYEKRATEFTDAIMAKNVGDAEPQRGTYAAIKEGERYAVDEVPLVLPTAQPTKGFDGLGAVDVAPVVDPLKASLQGLDLSALRGCSTDGLSYSAADTGSLAAAVQGDKQPTKAPGIGA